MCFLCVYVHAHIHVNICIYIYRERAPRQLNDVLKELDRAYTGRGEHGLTLYIRTHKYVSICICIYVCRIYIEGARHVN